MLARQLPTILPAMTLAEAIETTRIYSVAGLTGARTALVTTRPCRAPHQTISDAGRIGGGHVPMPGEVSLAHHGVRFLDARPECRRPRCHHLGPPLPKASRAFHLTRSRVWSTDTPAITGLSGVCVGTPAHPYPSRLHRRA
jgi:predicted ATPase with chaperone activity